MDKERIIYLYERQREHLATPAELAELHQLLQNSDAEKSLKDFWGEDWARISAEDQQFADIANHEQIFDHIVAQPQKINPGRRLWPRIAAAASIILAISAGSYFLLHKQQVQQTAQTQKQDIAPGHNQATLTLASGQKIILTKGLTGQLAVQNKTVIIASQNTIVYNATSKSDQLIYNTLSTARGEQSPYPLVLADGTKVWLNAESSITFPIAFNGKERIVKLTGEAYFEVVHNSKQPFKVTANGQTIEDIGTHFDVNAYADEPNTRTTLIEGSVKVNNIILKPGEQTDGRHLINTDTEAAIAWKNGVFMFDSENIQSIMRKVARWYAIDVTYQGDITTENFNGTISRYENVSQVIGMLQKTNTVHFKIEGRRITVMK